MTAEEVRAMLATADLADPAARAVLSDAMEEAGYRADGIDIRLLRCGRPIRTRGWNSGDGSPFLVIVPALTISAVSYDDDDFGRDLLWDGIYVTTAWVRESEDGGEYRVAMIGGGVGSVKWQVVAATAGVGVCASADDFADFVNRIEWDAREIAVASFLEDDARHAIARAEEGA